MPMPTYAALLTTRAPTMCHECCSCPYPSSCVLSSDCMGSTTGYIVALEDDAAATATATCTPSSKYASVSPPPQQLYRLPRSLLGIKSTHETSFLLRRALPTSLPSLLHRTVTPRPFVVLENRPRIYSPTVPTDVKSSIQRIKRRQPQ